MSSELENFQKHFVARIQDLEKNSLRSGLGTLLSELWDEFDYSLSSPRFQRLSSNEGAVGSLNAKLARLYCAGAARVGVAGSSVSNLAVIGFLVPLLKPGRNVIICERHAHQSLFGGIIASGMKAIVITNKFDDQLGITLPATPEQITELLCEYGDRVAAVCITSPTYEGLLAELPVIGRACRSQDALLIVDSAWGSTLGLIPGFPASPVQNADIVITSPHKSGLAPSQFSLVLFRDANKARIFDQIGDLGLATTSPNQLLLAIADYRYSLASTAPSVDAWLQVDEMARMLREHVSRTAHGVSALTSTDTGLDLSPVHVCFSTKHSKISCLEWANHLKQSHSIDPEYASEDLLVLLLGPGLIGQRDWLSDILVATVPSRNPLGISRATPKIERPLQVYSGPTDMRSAYLSEQREVTQSRLQTCRVSTYPPGRPDALPSEKTVYRNRSGKIRLLCLEPRNATQSQISDYARLFAEVFANAPFNQFALDPANPLEPLPASRFITSTKDQPQYLDEKALNAIELPAPFIRWIDGDVCRNEIARRCDDEGILVLAYDGPTLVAVLHLRSGSLRRIYETEEWQDPFLFSRFRKRHLAREVDFERKTNFHFNLGWNDPILTVSCMAIRPSYRTSLKLLFDMFTILKNHLPPQLAGYPVLAEVPEQGAARIIDMALNDRIVHGVLPNGHSVVFSQHGESVLEKLRLGYRHFKELVRRESEAVRAQWRPSPSDNASVCTRETYDRGLGVFATKPICAGDRIAVFEGELYRAKRATLLPSPIVNHAIQISDELFVSNEGGLAELVNHSCEPNSGIRDSVEIFAMRDIEPGEEITWDYRCSEDSDWILEHCLCGSPICTGRVAGFSSLPLERKKYYLENKAVSDWLRSRSFQA